MAQLTPNFSLEELTRTSSKYDNTPNQEEKENILATALHLEAIRAMLGGTALRVTSCFRSGKVNADVGGSKTSAHRYGLAADFTCPGFGTPRDIVTLLEKTQIPFDQLILEFPTKENPGGGWVHIGFTKGKPRRQVLTAKKLGGKTAYLPGIVGV